MYIDSKTLGESCWHILYIGWACCMWPIQWNALYVERV